MNAAVFHQAVADGDATRVKFLINLGQQARVNQRNKQGYTALQQSCKDGQYEVANVLLGNGANIAATDKTGRTALHLASAGGYVDLVKLLIASCANVNTKDNEGNQAIDVAKNHEIATLLRTVAEEKQPKSPEGNKSEDWSQNVTSLPPGSRNSLVSNSSSDSGVYTDDNTNARNNEHKMARANGYSGTRAMNNDNRDVMGVLHESDENHFDSHNRDKAHTVHDITSNENIYQENRARSISVNDDSIRSKHDQKYYEAQGEQLNERIIERNQCENGSHLNSGNGHQYENRHSSAQTSMKMTRNANKRQPKLRRSLSERLPSHQRRRLIDHRDVSDELAALNLSQAKPAASHYQENYGGVVESRAFAVTPEPHSPDEDLGYVEDIAQDFADCGYEENFYPCDPRALPRRQELYDDDLASILREGIGKELIYGLPQSRQNTFHYGMVPNINSFDNASLYKRSEPRHAREFRRHTFEKCASSSVEDRYRMTGDKNHAYFNNKPTRNVAQRGIPRNYVIPANGMYNSGDFNQDPRYSNVNRFVRRDSTRSDTAIASCRQQRLIQNRYDYSGIRNKEYTYCYEQEFSRSLPSYEETMYRQRSESNESRRTTMRQISQV